MNIMHDVLLKINNFCHQKVNDVVDKVVKKDVDDELV